MEFKQVTLEAADGSLAYAQPEVFDGVLLLAVQHAHGPTERVQLDSPRAERLMKSDSELQAAVDDAKAQAKQAGVATSPAAAAAVDTDALIEALRKAGLVVVPSQPAAAQPAAAAPAQSQQPAVNEQSFDSKPGG